MANVNVYVLAHELGVSLPTVKRIIKENPNLGTPVSPRSADAQRVKRTYDIKEVKRALQASFRKKKTVTLRGKKSGARKGRQWHHGREK